MTLGFAKKHNHNTFFFLFFLPALIGILYYPALGFDYVWDDWALIKISAKFMNESWISDTLKSHFYVSPNYYRPLPVLAITAEARISQSSPQLSHLINILIHTANSLLVYFITFELFKKKHLDHPNKLLVSFIAGGIYSIHPALVEPVAWISGRFDLLLTTFLLMAILCDLKISQKSYRFFAIFLLFYCAALSKETAAMFALILPLIHIFILAGDKLQFDRDFVVSFLRNNFTTYLAILLAGCLYLISRKIALGYVIDFGTLSKISDSPYVITDKILMSFKALALYLFYSLHPFSSISNVHPQEPPFNKGDLASWAGIAAFSLFILLATFRKLSIRFICIFLIFLLALIPVLHILPIALAENIIHERFLAFPLGVIIPLLIVYISTSFQPVINKSPALYSLCIVLWVTLALLNVRAGLPLWSSNTTLWTTAIKRHPESLMVQFQYATVLVGTGQDNEALEVLSKFSQHKSPLVDRLDFQYQCLMAKIYLDLNKFSDAEKILSSLWSKVDTKILQEDYFLVLANNTARAYIMNKKYEQAKEVLDQALKAFPDHPSLNYHLALYYKNHEANMPKAINAMEIAYRNSYVDPGLHESIGKELNEWTAASVAK